MKLCELAKDVKVGQILTRVSTLKNGDVKGNGIPTKVLPPKAISEGWIIKENIEEQLISKAADSDKYTREGDVVIKLSGPYDSAYIDKDNEGYLLPSFCAAIRVDASKIDPKYLAAYLNTSLVKQQLANTTLGVRPMIKVTDLIELEVPILSMRDMNALGEAYQLSGLKREKLRKLITAEEDLMNRIVISAIKGVK